MAVRVTGSVITVARKSGAVYYLKARDRTGRQVKRRLGPVADWTPKQARDELRDWLTDLGRQPDGPRESVTFAHAVAAWLHYIEHDRKRRPSTVRDYRSTVNVHLLPAFGDRAVHAITADDIDDWRRAQVLGGTLSDRSVNKTLIMLHGIFARAQRLYGLPTNPAAVAERQPVRRHGDIDVYDPGDVQLLAQHAANEQDAAIFTFAAFTGLRMGELLALRWRDVDFAKRLVHVRWSHVQGQENRPKSHRVRSVPLIDQAARALDGLSRRAHFTGLDDLVFVNTIGRHVDGSALRRRYLAAAEAGGLRRLRFHDLRHTFGTLAVQVFPLTDVKAYMGHANVETTMVYVHHRPAHDAADRLGAIVAAGTSLGTEMSETERNLGTRRAPQSTV